MCIFRDRFRKDLVFVGPITETFDTDYYVKWNRVWKVNKDQIQYHINNWNQPGYTPIEVIQNWPAHGSAALGQSANIAPFYDNNANGIYEPALGDYPLIRGDQAVFFVYNDVKKFPIIPTISTLGFEVHGMAYEYDKPEDSVLNNTLFMHYDIINRSTRNYHDTYLGLFTEFDIGNPENDYIGSDVVNGMTYCYNGSNTDPTNTNWNIPGYGNHPPAIGLKIIGGPFLAPDGLDNLAGECNNSLNGLNFGDNIADNERFGLTNFISSYINLNSLVSTYNFMQGYWEDGTKMIFGGNGRDSLGGVGPECNFMFPGNSDTICNYGTNGVPPNGGYNQNGKFWTESEVGNAPTDRNGLTSIGPFNFNAGETVPLDYCFTWARDYQGDNLSSLELLRQRIASLKPNLNNLITIPQTYYGVPDNQQPTTVFVYPNPMNGLATVKIKTRATYQVYSINGLMVKDGIFNPGNNLLDLSNLKSGVYMLKSENSSIRIVKN